MRLRRPKQIAIYLCGVIMCGMAQLSAFADDAIRQSRKSPVETATRFIAKHDSDKNGSLSRNEFPSQSRALFDRIDTDRDGQVTLKEDIAFRQGRARPAPDQRRSEDDGEVHRDLVYAQVDGVSLQLDVYMPSNPDGKYPLIVWIHGGAWRAGGKARCPATSFAERGFVVASIDYRLSQKAIFPAQIMDCKAAIRWLRGNSAKYHIDKQKVGVWGSSAGGHLVALLGTSGGIGKWDQVGGHRDQSSRVTCVVDFFGPTDFLQMDKHALPGSRLTHDAANSPESQLVGGAIQDHPDKVAQTNPITFVTDDDPPFLIVHGDKDPLVPVHQSRLLYDALTKTRVDATLHIVEGAGHGFGRNEKVDAMVREFFDRHLSVKRSD